MLSSLMKLESRWRSFEWADGSVEAADGSLEAADGSLEAADGSVEAADGSVEAADGSVEAADGSFEAADGSLEAADGSFEVAEHDFAALLHRLRMRVLDSASAYAGSPAVGARALQGSEDGLRRERDSRITYREQAVREAQFPLAG